METGCLLAGFAMRARAGKRYPLLYLQYKWKLTELFPLFDTFFNFFSAYIYIRGEFFNEAMILEEAIHEAYEAG